MSCLDGDCENITYLVPVEAIEVTDTVATEFSILNELPVTDDYDFNLIPLRKEVPTIALIDIKGLSFLETRKGSYIFEGTFRNQSVIIKMVKMGSIDQPTSLKEFDLELSVLLRCQHPNIIDLVLLN